MEAARTLRSKWQSNVYVGVGLRPYSLIERAEKPFKIAGGDKDIVMLPGLVADIDFEGEQHTKKKYPPADRALGLIANLQTAPSAVIHSGHGYQCWWLFDKPWLLHDDNDRARAYSLSEQWTRYCQAELRKFGYEMDSVFDLRRVMRLPGSLNHKGSDPLPVTIEQFDDIRYSIGDFESLGIRISTDSPQSRDPQTLKIPGLELSHNAQLPKEFLEDLLEDDAFSRIWNSKRPDLFDQTGSSYDMALANYMFSVGVDSQMTADAMIHWRRINGKPLKLRIDYFARTLRQAAENQGVDLDEQKKIAEPTTERELLLQKIGQTLKCEVIDFRESVGRNREERRIGSPTYHLTLSNAYIVLTAEDLDSALRFRRKITPHTKRVYPALKGNIFFQLTARLMEAVNTDVRQEDETPWGETMGWLSDYLKVSPGGIADDWRDTVLDGSNRPCMYDGRVCVSLASFGSWLHESRRYMSRQDLADRLREIGAQSVRKQGSKSGLRCNLRAWALPEEAVKEIRGIVVPVKKEAG